MMKPCGQTNIKWAFSSEMKKFCRQTNIKWAFFVRKDDILTGEIKPIYTFQPNTGKSPNKRSYHETDHTTMIFSETDDCHDDRYQKRRSLIGLQGKV